MYRGFNVKVAKINDISLIHKGHTLYKEHNQIIANQIDSFVLGNGTIDGSEMQSNWFPTINAEVFISHSHKDLGLAKALAGCLKIEFGLNSFIDSSVWGYSNDLLKQIDEKYCKKGNNLYSYEYRNFSTSHVHMMLASALTMMIDQAEVLFFLNTPQSLSSNDIKNKTMSPWIYFELATSRFIRKPVPKRLQSEALRESYSIVKTANPDIEYTMDFSEFIELREDQLKYWVDRSRSKGIRALNTLYEMCPLY